MELDSRQTIIVAVLVLFLGKYLNNKFNVLRKYNIPEPVTGGLVASLFFGLLFLLFNVDINFSTHYRDILLIVFFTAIFYRVNWGDSLLGIIIMILSSVLAFSGLSTLLASLTKSEEQIGSIGPALAMIFGFLGGSMWPVFEFPDWLNILR